jgi:putative copper export protein/methionine-rich copper-binding protein CopC
MEKEESMATRYLTCDPHWRRLRDPRLAANLWDMKLISRRMVAWIFGALAVLVTPALLFAHARLVRSEPAAGASVSAPTDLSLWFSETPELKFTHVRVTDSTGAEVMLSPPGAAPGMSVILRFTRALARGKYTVEWHTAAADGHSSSGKFAFTVIAAATSAVQSPAQAPPALSGSRPTAAANPVFSLEGGSVYSTPVRWMELVALLTIIGLAIFRLSIARDAKWTDDVAQESFVRAVTLARAVLLLFAIATLSRALAQAQLLGVAGGRIQSLEMLVRVTRWGFGWGVGAVGVIVAAVGLLLAGRAAIGWVIASVGIVAMCVSESLTGHSGSIAHAPLAIAVDVAHQLGAGGWVGGLAAVLLCAFPAMKRLGDAERAAAGSRLLRAYHGAAVECVSIVIASAIVAAWLRLPRLDALWTSDYGSMLLRKIFFVIILLIFGFYHWRRMVVPAWAETSARRFRRTAAAELVIAAVVVAITVLLASTSLPT